MTTERRQTPRSKPYEPVYVSLNSANRGIVIDASDEGLQFWTDSPVEHIDGTLPLRFKLNPLDQIETVGEIIWMDESKRTGGVRFKDLPEPLRANIRTWLEQNARALPTRADVASAPVIQSEPELPRYEEPVMAAPIEEPASATFAAETQYEPRQAPAATPGSEFAVPWRTAMPARPASGYSRGTSRRIASTFLIVLLMVVLALVTVVGLGLVSHWQIGGSAQTIGQNILKWASIGSQSGSDVSPADTNVSPLLRPPSKNRRLRPVGTDITLPAQPGPGDTELATALQYLRGDGGPAQTNLAVKWLWASVEKGNANAAMLLSDLYEWGRGVPQNCDQARVLLILASKHGSTEALQQLQDLDADGCGGPEASSK